VVEQVEAGVQVERQNLNLSAMTDGTECTERRLLLKHELCFQL